MQITRHPSSLFVLHFEQLLGKFLQGHGALFKK
jgi:hypothetical protein